MKDEDDQRARFAARSAIICDERVSAGAFRLFSFLDDEARGGRIVPSIKQPKIAFRLHVTAREVRRWLRELTDTGYMTSSRTLIGNQYEFVRKRADKNVLTGEDKNVLRHRTKMSSPSLLNSTQVNTQGPPLRTHELQTQNQHPAFDGFDPVEHDRRALEMLCRQEAELQAGAEQLKTLRSCAVA